MGGHSRQVGAILQADWIERTGTGTTQHLRMLLEPAHQDWKLALIPCAPTDRPGVQLSTPRSQMTAHGAKTSRSDVCAYAGAWKAEE